MAFSQTMSGVMEHVNNNSVSLLEISIKSLEHHITPMSVPRTSSVLDLKTKIQSLFHIDKRRQRLIFQGRVLKDEKQLLEYDNLDNGKIIHLVIRPPDPPRNLENDQPRSQLSRHAAAELPMSDGYALIAVDPNLSENNDSNSILSSLMNSIIPANSPYSGAPILSSQNRNELLTNVIDNGDSLPEPISDGILTTRRQPIPTSVEMRLSRTMAYISNIRNLLEIPLDQLDLNRHHHILPSSFRSVSQSRSLLREQAQTPAAQVGLVLEDLADLFDTTVPWLQDVGNALSDESVVMVDGRGLTENEQLSRILRTARIVQVMSLIHHFLGSALNTANIDSRRRNNRNTATAAWPPNNTGQTAPPQPTASMPPIPTPSTHHSSPQLAQTNNIPNAALNPSAIMSNAFATLNSLTPGRNTGGNNSINLNTPNTNVTTQNQPGNYSNSMALNSPTDRQNMRPNNPGHPNVINQAANRASMTLNSLNSLLNSTRATLAQANAGRGRAPPSAMYRPINPHNNQFNYPSGPSINPSTQPSPRHGNNSITLNSSDDPLGYPPGRHSPKRQKRNDGH